MGKFLPGVKISQLHGQARWIDWRDRKILVVPMYHPAAALRVGEVMRQFKADFGKLKQIIDNLNHVPKEEVKPEVPVQLNLV